MALRSNDIDNFDMRLNSKYLLFHFNRKNCSTIQEEAYHPCLQVHWKAFSQTQFLSKVGRFINQQAHIKMPDSD